MKNLFIFLVIPFIYFVSKAHSEEQVPLEIVGKVYIQNNSIKLIRVEDGKEIPIIIPSKNTTSIAQSMQSGDEAMVKGFIIYKTQKDLEGQIQYGPVFIIESIKPISLKNLGKFENPDLLPNYLPLKPEPYEKTLSATISPEITATIMITSSVLFLNSLSSANNSVDSSQEISTGSIFFTGLFVTGVFIYKQIKKNNLGKASK